MSAWRKRSCPECGHVGNAGAFRHVRGGSWGSDARRSCPSCRYEAPTSDFRVVDEYAGIPSTVTPNPDRCIVCGKRDDVSIVVIQNARRSAPACPVHSDPETVRYWYREWERFLEWSNR